MTGSLVGSWQVGDGWTRWGGGWAWDGVLASYPGSVNLACNPCHPCHPCTSSSSLEYS